MALNASTARLAALALILAPFLAPGLAGCAAPSPAPPAAGAGQAAPRPLYRDPHFDGAADVALVHNRGRGRWEMFYTNRRATLRLDDPKDVSWVHGTAIGIATSDDGNTWRHEATAQFPAACGGAPGMTQWAPEIAQDSAGRYHLWLTLVPGIHKTWTGTRYLQHLSSTDLRQWQCEDRLDLGSDRVIDASVVQLPDGRWRLWFKDEVGGSRLKVADSSDAVHWQLRGAVSALPAEGPKVFRHGGHWWLIADLWKGLLVLRSDDAEHWQEQPARLLAEAGRHPTDRAKGQHPDVQVVDGRAYLFYFVHQGGEAAAQADDRYHQRTVIQVAELTLVNGWLAVDRDAPPPDLRAAFGGRKAR